MQYRQLTGTGLKVSRVCLGTMTFGPEWKVSEADSIKMIHYAMDAGINFVDTADAYSNGVTESILGKALVGRRGQIVLASKVWNYIGGDKLKDAGLSRWHIIRGVEDSLRRLNTDCLDILYFHQPDHHTPLEESLEAADYLVKQGKVMYLGMSNYAAWQVCKALWCSERQNIVKPVVAQNVYNLITRGLEEEFLLFAQDQQIAVVTYNPLAGGLLSGKYNRGNPPSEHSRLGFNANYKNRYWQDSILDAVEQLKQIAVEAGITPVALAYQWLLGQEQVDSVILGASRLEQLQENLSYCGGKLDAAIAQACDSVWQTLRGAYYRYYR